MDEFLRLCVLPLFLIDERSLHLFWRRLQDVLLSAAERKPPQLLLNPSHGLEHWSQLRLDLLRTAIAVLMQIVPIILKQVLDLLE